ncbi:MAG TPA: hypothetical protein VIU81_05850 [Gaiellaceae bacterium]
MGGEIVTRTVLVRALARNAATRPLNIVVPVLVATAGPLLHTAWLLFVAFLVYIGMAIATFFDADEAERVGRATYDHHRQPRRALDAGTLSPEIAHSLERAREEESRIREAVERSPLPRYDILDEVARLLAGLEKIAGRAQQIQCYLADQDQPATRERLRRLRSATAGDAAVQQAKAQAAVALEEQLAVTAQLEAHLARFDAQLEHAVASLAAIHGQIVRMGAAEEAASQRDVAAEVRDLRRSVNLTADALRETYDELTQDDS